ncbi:MAG: hypothetical protein JSV91_10545 [Phycisphaerales bacterium]|nr:MAG: hypothetical protein JSV91_10545 [Phycisphaerales bacterium]
MGGRSVLVGTVTVLALSAPLNAEQKDVLSTEAEGARCPQPAEQPTLGRVGEELPDPLAFFQKLVERYRRLTTYRDTAQIVEITERQGQAPKRVEKRIACEIEDGELQVTTPAEQLLRRLGLVLPMRQSPVMDKARKDYDRWLAPHMTMKFAAEPLQDFRPGVEQGFTATEVGPVTIDQKEMVHLQLKSGDGRKEKCDATFDLFVDPESMLIERIEGEQQLSDGASYQTTIEIDPERDAITEAGGPDEAPSPGEAAPEGEPPDGGPPIAPPTEDEDSPPANPAGEGGGGDTAGTPPRASPPLRPGKPQSPPPNPPPVSGSGSDGQPASGEGSKGPAKPPANPNGPPPVDSFKLR